MLVPLLDLLTVTVIALPVFIGVIRFSRTRRLRTVDVILGVMLIVFCVPLVLDHFQPIRHQYQPDLVADATIRVKSNLVLITAVLLLLWGAHARKGQQVWLAIEQHRMPAVIPQNAVVVLWALAWIVLLLPLPVTLLLSPDPWEYLTYGGKSGRGVVSYEWHEMHRYIDLVNLLSLAGFALVYWIAYRRTRTWFSLLCLLALLAVFPAVYINGKRHFLAFVLLIISAIHLVEGRAKWSLFLLPVVLFVFTIAYMLLGGKGEWGERMSPTTIIRGDLSRDYTLRMTVANTAWSYNTIMPYRGYSLHFLAVKFIPRQLYPSKPYTPPSYFTWYAKDMSGPLNVYQLQGVLQYGFIEELLLNFGYLGLIGCFLIGRVTRWFDATVGLRRPQYILAWYLFPLSVAFASNVISQVGLLIVLPLLLAGRILSNPNNWLVMSPVPDYDVEWGQEWVHEAQTEQL